MSALQITDTNFILADYVLLPIQDLHQKFLFKVQTPIELCWITGEVSLLKALWDKHDLQSAIEWEVAQYFSKIIEDARDEDGRLPEQIRAWGSPLQVKLRECHIVPKE